VTIKLVGPHVQVVPFEDRHLTEAYLGWLNDPETMRFSENRHRTHTLDTCRAYAESFLGTPHCFWAIETDALGHVGNINAYVDEPNRVADVGILVGHRESWGKGIGLEAWMLVCSYLFMERGLRKVTAGTSANNVGMRRIMEKSGMVVDGVRSRHLMIDGQEVDVVYAAIFAKDWPAIWSAWAGEALR